MERIRIRAAQANDLPASTSMMTATLTTAFLLSTPLLKRTTM